MRVRFRHGLDREGVSLHAPIMLYDQGLGLPPANFGSALRIENVIVPRWVPEIIVADGIAASPMLEILGYRAPSKFTAPEILFSDPQPMLVRGGSFAVVTERQGIVPGSTYLLGDYDWKILFAGIERTEMLADRDVLVAANGVWMNHYHWIFQCLAPILVGQANGLGDEFAILLPQLGPIERASLMLAGIDPARIVELPDSAAAVTGRGIYSNLTTGDFAFVPHPAIIASLEAMGRSAPVSRWAGKRVFISRADASKRRMVNEAQLSEALMAAGFEMVLCGALSFPEQAALFRDAELIVAQHGAALINLLFARDGGQGPMVVELHQENYIQQTILKMCQVKRLRYWAVVNPMVDPGPDGRHDSTWMADIPLITKLVNGL